MFLSSVVFIRTRKLLRIPYKLNRKTKRYVHRGLHKSNINFNTYSENPALCDSTGI